MRIAYVTETFPPELNGVALTVDRTVRHLQDRGHDVLLVRPGQPGDDASSNPAAAGRCEWHTAGCPIPMYRDLRLGWSWPGQMKRRLAAWRPQLVHVATPGPLAHAAVAAAGRLDTALTSDFRTNFHQYSRYYRLGWFEPTVRAYLRRLHARCDLTFVPTRQLQTELAGDGFGRLVVVGRGVDTVRFAPSRRCDATRAPWAAGAGPVLLCAGRLAAEKNVGLALAAFDAVRHRQPSARLVVVGDGPLRSELEARCPGARFAGVQRGDDLARYYASADIFLFPSLSDTFGNVVLEALASGLPVVAFRTAAAAEHVVDNRSGRLAEPGDDAGFIAAAVGLAGDPTAIAAARPAARAAALAADWDRVLDSFEQHLEATVHARRIAASGIVCAA